MKISVKVLIHSIILILLVAGSAYADSVGGPHLWLSTDPNQFDELGLDYVGDAPGWLNDSYVKNNLPFSLYLYNSASEGTATNIGLIVVVHDNEAGSIIITDPNGVDHEYTEADFSSTPIPYPGGGHGVYDGGSDGIFAVLTPDPGVNLTIDSTGNADTTSDASSWAEFIVKSSSFSEFHFDAISDNGFYNPASHDVTWGDDGNGSVPEPATLSLLGLGLFGLLKLRKKNT